MWCADADEIEGRQGQSIANSRRHRYIDTCVQLHVSYLLFYLRLLSAAKLEAHQPEEYEVMK